jgi:plastocyanin
LVGVVSPLGEILEYTQQPDKRLIALIILASALVPLLIASELALPGLQPKVQAASPPSSSSSSSGSTPSSVVGVKVVIPTGTSLNHNLDFTPSALVLVIGVNNSVTWFNMDTTDHTATFTVVPTGVTPSSISASDIPPGTSFGPVLFTVPGTYDYHCQFHPGWMRGTIIVKAAT